MSKLKQKTLFIFSVMVFFVLGYSTEASVIINEIQIAPTTERFVELYNNSDSEVDLTGYYLQRKTSTSDKYTSFVTNTKLSGKKIPANSFFLITKDSLGLESLTITESNSIQLKNSKQEVVYKIGLGESNDCGNACVPNPGNSQSVQRMNNGEWLVGNPSPGDQNIKDSENEVDNQEDVVYSETEKKKEDKQILNPTITTKIISPKVVVAGVPFTIDQETIGYKGEKIIFDRFVWNFGDGNAKEMNPCLPFEYTYFYPGDYALVLSYYETFFSKIPEATNRLNIKVIPSGINIVSVGSISDPYIEIENNSSHEMTLKNWSIKGFVKTFTIPDGTTILPNKKIKFSPKITGFNFEDLSSVTIVDEDGSIFAIYPKPKNLITKKPIAQTITANKKDVPDINNSETKNNNKEIIDLNNLQASVHSSKNNSSSGIVYFGLFSIIAIGVIAIIVIKNNKKEGLEGELSAKDIKIIE